jgi:hypothetical protein
MLLDSIALSTIAGALKVSYNAVAITVGHKRAFGPGIDEVLLFNILCIHSSVN